MTPQEWQEKKIKFDQKLDGLGQKWYEAKQNGDMAVKRATQEEIAIMMYEYANTYVGRAKKTPIMEVIPDFWAKEIKNSVNPMVTAKCYLESFDPQRGKLSHYIAMKLEYLRIEAYEKKVEINAHETTIDTNGEFTPMNKGDEEIYPPIIKDGPEKDYVDNGSTIEFLALICNLSNKLKGKADNATRRYYFKLFSTDFISYYLMEKREELKGKRERSKNRRIAIEEQHGRDIFAALEKQFLDYYMIDKCETIWEIQKSEVKRNCDLFDGGDNKTATTPLSNKVYLAYFQRILEQKIGDSHVSNQRKVFNESFLQQMKDSGWRC